MNLKLSRNSILFIEPLARLSSIFGLLPYYNFQIHSLKNIKLYKLHSLVLASLLAIISMGLIYLRSLHLYKIMSRSLIILDLLLEIVNLVTFEIIILGSSQWNITTWQKLFQCLHQIESKQNLDVKPKKHKNILTNPNLLVLVGSIMLPLLFSFELYYHRKEIYYCYIYLSLFFYYYVEFLYMNIITNIIVSIKWKYESIHNLLSNILTYSNNSKKATDAIRKIKVLFLAVDHIVTIFNTLFGLPILFMLGGASLLTLNSIITFSGTSSKLFNEKYFITPEIVLIDLGYIALAWVRTIII